MARIPDGPDTELNGTLITSSRAAYNFLADDWTAPEWIPMSASDWIPDPDRRDEKGGILMVRDWLARKNGWRK